MKTKRSVPHSSFNLTGLLYGVCVSECAHVCVQVCFTLMNSCFPLAPCASPFSHFLICFTLPSTFLLDKIFLLFQASSISFFHLAFFAHVFLNTVCSLFCSFNLFFPPVVSFCLISSSSLTIPCSLLPVSLSHTSLPSS